MAKNAAVYGIYPNSSMVEKAVEKLKVAGFRHADISVLFPAGAETREFAVKKETKAPEGAATGAGTGAAWCPRSRGGHTMVPDLQSSRGSP